MKKKFYELGATFVNKWYWGRIITDIDPAILGKKGMRGYNDVVRVKIVEGTTPGDFLWNGLCLLIVSRKTLEVWEQFENFETYSVSIEGGVSPIEYSGVAMLGRAGPFDPVKSKAVFSRESDPKVKPIMTSMDGFYFDEDKWDGSDLCTIDEFPKCNLVTERVVKAMKNAKLTNCRYDPIEKIRM